MNNSKKPTIASSKTLKNSPPIAMLEPIAQTSSPMNRAKRNSAILPLRYSVMSATCLSPVIIGKGLERRYISADSIAAVEKRCEVKYSAHQRSMLVEDYEAA
jgi:hypothetical protein